MPAKIKFTNPDGVPAPLGHYSNMASVEASKFLFIAGQVAIDADGKVVGPGDFQTQAEQTFANLRAALASAGAGFGNVVQFTTYLTNASHIADLFAYRERRFPELFGGDTYPPNTLLIVSRLVKPELLIEVQAIAAACSE